MRFVLMLMVGCNGLLDQRPGIVDDAGCAKICAGHCASLDDPAHGCTATSCGPCVLDHATAACSAGACTVASCDATYDDLDLNPTNGCESRNPLAFASGSLALWLRADEGIVTDDAGITGWTNMVDGVVQPTATGKPQIDDTAWPLASLKSVRFSGKESFSLDLSSMMSPSGFTAFVAYARYGNNPAGCFLGSPTYPVGDPKVICPGAAGQAFQLGYLSNTLAFYEVYCNSMWIASPSNGVASYQSNLAEIWFDPNTSLNYFSLNGSPLSDVGQTPHALIDMTGSSVLGGCAGQPGSWVGLVGEIVVYSTLLSADDRAELSDHLKVKWKTP